VEAVPREKTGDAHSPPVTTVEPHDELANRPSASGPQNGGERGNAMVQADTKGKIASDRRQTQAKRGEGTG